MIRSLALAMFGLGASACLASGLAGTFRADQRLHSLDVVLRYDLDLHSTGRAELRVSSSRGRVSPRDRDIQQFGTVLEVLERERQSVHRGDWSFDRGRVRVSLTNRNNRNVISQFEFREGDTGLQPTRWDTRNYGARSLSFSRVRSHPSAGVDRWEPHDRWSGEAFRGTWEARGFIGAGKGELVRRIVLDRGGRATIEWSRIRGTDERFDRREIDRFGQLLQRLEQTRSFRHEGRFELRGSSVVLRLDRVGSDFVRSTLEFRIERDGLRLTSWDRRNYGSDGFFARER